MISPLRYNSPMLELVPLQPVDYLVIGHVAVDITPTGVQLGGTVSFAALTARALGMRVGIVTSSGEDAPLQALDGIAIVNVPSEHSTTFENIKTDERTQTNITSSSCADFAWIIFRKSGEMRRSFILRRLRVNWIQHCQKNYQAHCWGSLRKAGCARGMKMVRWQHVPGKTANRLFVTQEPW